MLSALSWMSRSGSRTGTLPGPIRRQRVIAERNITSRMQGDIKNPVSVGCASVWEFSGQMETDFLTMECDCWVRGGPVKLVMMPTEKEKRSPATSAELAAPLLHEPLLELVGHLLHCTQRCLSWRVWAARASNRRHGNFSQPQTRHSETCPQTRHHVLFCYSVRISLLLSERLLQLGLGRKFRFEQCEQIASDRMVQREKWNISSSDNLLLWDDGGHQRFFGAGNQQLSKGLDSDPETSTCPHHRSQEGRHKGSFGISETAPGHSRSWIRATFLRQTLHARTGLVQVKKKQFCTCCRHRSYIYIYIVTENMYYCMTFALLFDKGLRANVC